jgi:Fic family protein
MLFMVSLIEKKNGSKKVYYLHITKRTKLAYENKDLYLGSKLPENLRERKLDFFISTLDNKLLEISNLIKKNKKDLPKTIMEKNLLDFSIKFTYNSNKLEGNTLSLKESYLLLKDQISPQKSIKDIKEIQDHQRLFLELIKSKQVINKKNLLDWHYKLLKETNKDVAGKIRTYSVEIAGCKFKPPTPIELNFEVSDFFNWYNKNINKYNPVIFAALIHLKLVTIHPFGDSNGRISRLLMNIILNNSNYPLFIIENKDRKSYYSSLERSQLKEDDSYFLNWFIKKYIIYIKNH